MRTILLVDDEVRMLDLVELFLLPLGFKCIKETSGKNAIELVKREKIDLIILDIMMPEVNGWEVCEEIRQFSNIPIIMLTARADKVDLAKGLNTGADDYISKPFDERELIARINAILRRSSKDESNYITYNDFILDKEKYSLHFNDLTVQLTLKEYYIIQTLISRPSKTYTREELLHSAWEYETDIDIRTIDSHIRNLREKLRNTGFPTNNFLNTVWGIGYKWD